MPSEIIGMLTFWIFSWLSFKERHWLYAVRCVKENPLLYHFAGTPSLFHIVTVRLYHHFTIWIMRTGFPSLEVLWGFSFTWLRILKDHNLCCMSAVSALPHYMQYTCEKGNIWPWLTLKKREQMHKPNISMVFSNNCIQEKLWVPKSLHTWFYLMRSIINIWS